MLAGFSVMEESIGLLEIRVKIQTFTLKGAESSKQRLPE